MTLDVTSFDAPGATTANELSNGTDAPDGELRVKTTCLARASELATVARKSNGMPCTAEAAPIGASETSADPARAVPAPNAAAAARISAAVLCPRTFGALPRSNPA